MADKMKEVATEEAARLRTLAAQAVHSKAYLYPIKVCFMSLALRFSLKGKGGTGERDQRMIRRGMKAEDDNL